MALDITPGSATADSYASLADATARLADLGFDVPPDVELEPALRRATTWLDGAYEARFPGQRTNGRAQARAWPRKNVIDGNGQLILDNIIPIEVMQATIEAARYEVDERGILDLVADPAGIKRKREQVGPLVEETEYATTSAKVRKFVSIDHYLRNVLLDENASTAWVVRA
jgi:hypothetical protein